MIWRVGGLDELCERAGEAVHERHGVLNRIEITSGRRKRD